MIRLFTSTIIILSAFVHAASADELAEQLRVNELMDKVGVEPIWTEQYLDIYIEDRLTVIPDNLKLLREAGSIRSIVVEKMPGLPSRDYSFLKKTKVDRLVIFWHIGSTKEMLSYVRECDTLRELVLGLCEVTPDDAKTLAECRQLASISISPARITKAHFDALGKASPNLKKLRIQSGNNDKLVAFDIAELKALQLTTLTLKGFDVTEDTKKTIRSSLDPCEVKFE
ncbi:hypothetical protein [Blastopirellula marina]|uniref:Leucine Rich repeats (2 copies) n=1 Tax=Blastopirellula marina TaxID=124 RepID=A0A2S8GGD6_9BACT|nr:hypothetical protein [Blastopirellula marina]PQO43509.1 hypothetical protein C5Y93_22920 [Blastopirellula marina]